MRVNCWSFLFLLLLLIPACDRGKPNEGAEQIAAMNQVPALNSSSVFLVSGDHVFCFRAESRYVSRKTECWLFLSGLSDYLNEPHVRQQYNLDEDDELHVYSGGVPLTQEQNTVTMHDEDKSQDIFLFNLQHGKYCVPNKDIYYIDVLEENIVLANGFKGKIELFGVQTDIIDDGIYVTVRRRESTKTFGEDKLTDIDTEKILLVQFDTFGVDYFCIGYQGLLTLLETLDKSPASTAYPFLLKLF